MPNSNMSRLSVAGHPKTHMASALAREAAEYEIRRRVATGQLDPRDVNGIKREFNDIYKQEYYKNYSVLALQEQPVEKIIYLPSENPSANRFIKSHKTFRFSKTNFIIYKEKGTDISFIYGRFEYPLDQDTSLDTKEASLTVWPGPLDRPDSLIKRKTTDYIDTLEQHDSERRIRYTNSSEDQRRIILKLLTELLHRNGFLDASGVTKLLLKSEQTEIQKDESNRRPLETLQKYLLLGKRAEAVKFARSRKLWDHAQCLAYLDKYQPQYGRDYFKDGLKLRDDSIVQLNDEYINSLDQEILNTVYRSLLNRILQKDLDSVNLVKRPNVGNDAYRFAILSANDCDMEFDQSNEVFKLINAMKKALDHESMSNSHLISLGLTAIDTFDISEDLSYRSILSFRQTDTDASRTLANSNIDMLILNEIWEYCLNLARGTADPETYEYIFDLIPSKLVFASRILDAGLYNMFAYYLVSIENALMKIKLHPHIQRDDFYDWDTIERSVAYLRGVWNIFLGSPDFQTLDVLNLESPPANMVQPMFDGPKLPPAFDTFQPQSAAEASTAQLYDTRIDHLDSSNQDYPSLPYQNDRVFSMPQNFPQIRPPYLGYSSVPPSFNNPSSQPTIPEEPINDFNPEHDPSEVQETQYMQNQETSRYQQDVSHQDYSQYNDYSNEPSRRTSLDAPPYSSFFSPPYSPPSANQSNSGPDRNATPMTSSSPLGSARPVTASTSSASARPTKSSSPVNSNGQAKPDEAQSSGLLANLAGSVRGFLPKSNSKQMILPDDSKPSLVWDEERKTWVDTSKPDGEAADDYNEPPPPPPRPVDGPSKPQPPYSSAPKSSRSRYPKPQMMP